MQTAGALPTSPPLGWRPTLRPAGRRRWTDRCASGPSTAATALTVPLGTWTGPSGQVGGPGRQGRAHPGRPPPPSGPLPRRWDAAGCDPPSRAGSGWPVDPLRPAATRRVAGHRPPRGWPGRPRKQRRRSHHGLIPYRTRRSQRIPEATANWDSRRPSVKPPSHRPPYRPTRVSLHLRAPLGPQQRRVRTAAARDPWPTAMCRQAHVMNWVA